MDAHLLHSAIKAGAYILSNAAISEPVKDSYRALKSKVAELYGSRASGVLDKIECEDTRNEGERQLTTYIPNVEDAEGNELTPIVAGLIEAIRLDPQAQTLVQQARIDLDLTAGGDIAVQRIQGATDFGMRASAGGDVTVSDIGMGSRGLSGN